MRGKRLFALVRPFAIALGFIFRFCPMFIAQMLWDLSSFSEMKALVFLRYCILRGVAPSCGDNVYIGKNVTIKPLNRLTVGCNVSIHNNCYIDTSGGVRIENDVSIAHNSTILSSSHSWAEQRVAIKYNDIEFKESVIESDVWIGCGVRVMAGVTVGSRAIVGANSVCTKSLGPRGLYVGSPAIEIRKL